MRYSKLLIPFLVLLALACSCKSEFEMLLASPNPVLKYGAAMKYFNDGKYGKAAQLFESLSLQTSGTAQDDTVQFYWGLSNYKNKDYYTAETNFNNFVQHFPMSVFTPDAEFYRIDCMFRSTLRYELDQTPTYKAIAAISEYMIKHTEDAEKITVCSQMLDNLNWRLDKKAFENAKLYYRMEDYKAARVALKNVLKDDSENIFREDILYYTAMASYKYALNSVAAKQKERYMVFVDDYLNFVGEFPESKYKPELDGLYKKLK